MYFSSFSLIHRRLEMVDYIVAVSPNNFTWVELDEMDNVYMKVESSAMLKGRNASGHSLFQNLETIFVGIPLHGKDSQPHYLTSNLNVELEKVMKQLTY